jgi:hypothetical protein
MDLPIGRSRLHGRMASDGSRHRLAIYWIEPTPLREGTHFLRYGDFLFASDLVQYRIDGAPQTQSVSRYGDPDAPLLPQDASATAVAQCALAILARIEHPAGHAHPPLEIGRFFATSRGRDAHTLEILPDETDDRRPIAVASSDVDRLNTLPGGRRYAKTSQDNGLVIWRAVKAIDDRPLFAVTITPLAYARQAGRQEAFDPNTLGRWSLVPDAYHIYWSLACRYATLDDSADARDLAAALCNDMEGYLDMATPIDVRRALDRLRLKTALRAEDLDRLQQATQAALEGLRRDDKTSPYILLLELAPIASEIRKQYPHQADAWLRPLVALPIRRAGEDVAPHLRRLVSPIVNNKWFAYGDLVMSEARRQACAPVNVIDALAEKLDTSQIAAVPLPSDPTPGAKRYLAQLDADPPAGVLTLSDVRHILDQGLAHQYADETAKCAIVERTVKLIRPCVGDGPFRGDAEALTESVKRFSNIYLDVRKIAAPIDATLATLLALSFCDMSTPEDHHTLGNQYRDLAADLSSQLTALLNQYELTALIGPGDLTKTFAEQEGIFQGYVEDPLWPTFKFPLTANEQTRLAHKLKLRLERIEPLLDEMSDKVRYGGVSERLKKRTIFEIARVAENLMVEMAFLRRPSYPGVSTQYRGRHGFTAVIDDQVYEPRERAKQRFRVMKYFHMGHRLDETVRKERERVRPPDTPSD